MPQLPRDPDERPPFLGIQWDIDERLIRLLDLASDHAFRECLPEIGATDAGLIQLALQHECVLITEDTSGRLRGRRGCEE